MKNTPQYRMGQKVWFLDKHTLKAKEAEITGIRASFGSGINDDKVF